MRELSDRLACVSSAWTPEAHLHIGNVQWAAAGGDGSPAPSLVLTWGNPLLGFADAWLDEAGAEVSFFLSPDASPQLRSRAIRDIADIAPSVGLQAARQDAQIVRALSRAGFAPDEEGPWFAQLWRSLTDLTDLERFVAPQGYAVRATRVDELDARVALHRRCWAPARIKALLGLPISGHEAGSSYSIAKHEAVRSSPSYRPGLDLVVEDRDGNLVAYGLGWLDPVSRSLLFEPIGTDPEHGGRGLARVVCSEMLRRAAALGATQAVVGPRGDDAYPLPRRVYEGLGMREVAQFLSFTRQG